MSAFVISRCRQQGWLVGLVLLLGAAAPASAQLTSGLISQEQAARVGLKRAWFARAQIDPSRSRVVDWVLSGDQLLLVTDSGVIHALDANTGKSNWITEFGNPNYPSLGPDANDKFVAVINGSTVYLLDAKSGRIQGDRPLGGAPGAGPAVGNHHVFAPMINGLIEGYPLDLDAPQYKRWFYQSVGHILAPPLVTPESVVWTTDRGNMYVSGAERPGVRFRLETFSSFEARPAYRAPLIFAITVTGEMFAVDELSGQLVWRYTTGYATDRAPAAVGDKLFVTSDEPMLHCVDANTGAPLWRAPGVSQFAAASKQHVYGTDRYGTVYILNIADGSTVARVPTGGMFDALVNTDWCNACMRSGPRIRSTTRNPPRSQPNRRLQKARHRRPTPPSPRRNLPQFHWTRSPSKCRPPTRLAKILSVTMPKRPRLTKVGQRLRTTTILSISATLSLFSAQRRQGAKAQRRKKLGVVMRVVAAKSSGSFRFRNFAFFAPLRLCAPKEPAQF
jgi:outer membrane protein assembly factor BamB